MRIFNKNFAVCGLVLAFLPISPLTAQNSEVKFSKKVDFLGTSAALGLDTLGVTLNIFAEGDYDTVWQVITTFDTISPPADILIGIDLSGSMSSYSNGTSRIQQVKTALIQFLEKVRPGDHVAFLGWTGNSATSLADSANSAVFYKEIFPFSDDPLVWDQVLQNNLAASSGQTWMTYNGTQYILTNSIGFGNTPLHLATVVGLQYLVDHGQSTQKIFIQLTDGLNNDAIPLQQVLDFTTETTQQYGTRLFTIGFLDGNVTALTNIAQAGNGTFFDVQNQQGIDSTFDDILGQILIPRVDTVFDQIPILVPPDTLRQPLDLILAFDLSGSMQETDGTARWRITWAQISALGFLQNLSPSDRVGILGWTSTSSFSGLNDTANTQLYYQKWLPFTSNRAVAEAFIRDSLYLDGNALLTDAYNGMTLTIQDNIPGSFGDTPLNSSIIVAVNRMASLSSNPNKAVIVLTDGENRDNLGVDFVKTYLADAYQNMNISLHAIGFNGGDTAALQDIAASGGGFFYRADDPTGLDSAYDKLSEVIFKNYSARDMVVQDVLGPNQTYIFQSRTVLNPSNVSVLSFNLHPNIYGYTVLEWHTSLFPIFGRLVLYYKYTAPPGTGNALTIPSPGQTLTDVYTNLNYIDVNNQVQALPLISLGLRDLDLSDFRLSSIPPDIELLSNLESLNLSGNIITFVPPELGLMIDLRDLNLSGNQLTGLPPSFEWLVNLETLNLSDNNIDIIPDLLARMSGLIDLDLSGNNISFLPYLGALNQLEVLNLSNNNLEFIDADLADLNNLRILDLSSNSLVTLPDEIINLGAVQINVDGNSLCYLSPQVEAWLDANATNPNWRQEQNVDVMACYGLVDVAMTEAVKPDVRVKVAREALHIEFTGLDHVQNVSLYNLKGRLVRSSLTPEASGLRIDISDVPSGLYYLKVRAEGAGIVKKVLIAD